MLVFPETILEMYADTKPVYRKVYNILRATILSGQAEAMERLTEVGVSQALGISRTPVRAALAQLKSEGILDVMPKKGTGVKQLSRTEKANLLFMDEMLESTAAYLAAANSSQEDLDTLIEINNRIRYPYQGIKNEEGMKGIRDLHLQFHLMIARMSGNSFLYKDIVEIRGLMRMLSNDGYGRLSDYTNIVTPCHDKLLEAMGKGDQENARLWMKVDITLLKKIYMTCKIN